MAHEKRGIWWGIGPEGKKAFGTETEAVAYEGGATSVQEDLSVDVEKASVQDKDLFSADA